MFPNRICTHMSLLLLSLTLLEGCPSPTTTAPVDAGRKATTTGRTVVPVPNNGATKAALPSPADMVNRSETLPDSVRVRGRLRKTIVLASRPLFGKARSSDDVLHLHSLVRTL